jgi:hypothetical protein
MSKWAIIVVITLLFLYPTIAAGSFDERNTDTVRSSKIQNMDGRKSVSKLISI